MSLGGKGGEERAGGYELEVRGERDGWRREKEKELIRQKRGGREEEGREMIERREGIN